MVFKRQVNFYDLFLVRLSWRLLLLLLFWSSSSLLQISVSVEAAIMMVAATSSNSDVHGSWNPRPIPTGPLVIGYAHDAISGKVQDAIERGANVICWSFVDMVSDEEEEEKNNVDDTQKQQQQQVAAIKTNLNLNAIRNIREHPSNKGVLHIAAIGGWNGPHPPSGLATGQEWCHKFVEFNRQHGYIFDGIDWDLEGQDDRDGPRSTFTLETLDIMADFSREAKENFGMVVSMAPAESYLDCMAHQEEDLAFSFDLNLFPRSWKHNSSEQKIIQDANFAHAGRQCYAYVLHRAGIETFDWVALQLYEAYSVFIHDVTRRQKNAADVIVARAEQFKLGYTVSNLPTSSTDNNNKGKETKQTEAAKIQVPLSKLVIGIANGWADGVKFCQVSPNSLQQSIDILNEGHGETYRGVMFWTIDEEGNGGIHLTSSIASLQFDTVAGLNKDTLQETATNNEL